MGPGMGVNLETQRNEPKNGGEEWNGVMISVVEWVWGRGDVAMETGDLLFSSSL